MTRLRILFFPFVFFTFLAPSYGERPATIEQLTSGNTGSSPVDCFWVSEVGETQRQGFAPYIETKSFCSQGDPASTFSGVCMGTIACNTGDYGLLYFEDTACPGRRTSGGVICGVQRANIPSSGILSCLRAFENDTYRTDIFRVDNSLVIKSKVGTFVDEEAVQ